MSDYNEKRSRLRIDYEATVTICPKGQGSIKGKCSNVSMDGIYLHIDSLLAVETECGVQIVLQGPNSTLTIDIDGVVARSEKGIMAIQFKDNLEWWAIFTIYAQYSGNSPTGSSLCCSETAV